METVCFGVLAFTDDDPIMTKDMSNDTEFLNKNPGAT